MGGWVGGWMCVCVTESRRVSPPCVQDLDMKGCEDI